MTIFHIWPRTELVTLISGAHLIVEIFCTSLSEDGMFLSGNYSLVSNIVRAFYEIPSKVSLHILNKSGLTQM